MRALVFDNSWPRLAATKLLASMTPRAFVGPLAPLQLREVAEPELPAADWVVIRTGLCGLCGSDYKQVFLNGSTDNAMTAMISFPQVLGHEVVRVIEAVGPAVRKRRIGERVVLNPWLSCVPRGLKPCRWCQSGQLAQCENFTRGDLAPGIHTGNSRHATGGFARSLPAHESQCFPIPDEVGDETAVLADPFSVSLHALLKRPPKEGGVDVVYDSVGSPETIEVGVRVTRSRGAIVVTGVEAPRRFEWTPLYFKEIQLLGSNAFGVEEYRGRRQHAMDWYFELLRANELDLSSIITHRFRLEQYREAFLTCYDQGRSRAVKVLFDHGLD
jgi:threonine dehydrogenase-like Zn-dependent dehydrogenase